MPNRFATETEELGFSAYDSGLTIWDNPYEVTDPLWLEWRDGWLDADYIAFEASFKDNT